MADIVLSTINAKWIHPSLALRLLKANLGEYEGRCEIVELALRQSLEEKLAILAGTRPKILGLSVSIWNHKASLELLKALWKIRKRDSGTEGTLSTAEFRRSREPVIVLGGPEVSYMSEGSEIIRYADFVIRSEGENAFAELCKRILNGEKFPFRLVSSFNAGNVINGPVVDVSAIHSAYRLYSDEDLRRKLIYVEASRDCPFACAFCQSAIKASGAANPVTGPPAEGPPAEGPPTKGPPAKGPENPRRKTVREFPLDDFLSDMERLLRRLCSVRSASAQILSRPTIKFLDRSFNVNIPRALSIMEFFLEKVSAVFQGNLQLHFEIVPSLFPPELKEMVSRFPQGTLRLELGIQSFNPEVCAAINRPSDPEKELETLRFLRTRTNVIVHADLIAGLPGEDLASFGEGFDRLWRALTTAPVTVVAEAGAAVETTAAVKAGTAAETTAGMKAGTAVETAAGMTSGLPSVSPPFEIQLGILKGLPGTPLRELDKKFGMTYSSEPPYEVIETAAIGRADLDRLRNFARFWELIVNRPWKPNGRDSLSENPKESAAGLFAGNPAAALLLSGKPVFWPFMELSEKLFRFFGRNWGIDRSALKAALDKTR
jgi:hypothetical protein